MKIRAGYVTNSSSSSFILAFKDEADYNEFVEQCDMYDYKDFYKLIKNFKKHKDNTDKEKALETLYRHYTCLFQEKYIDSKIKSGDYPNFLDYIKARDELKDSEEFKEYIKDALKNTDYEDQKKQIKDSYLTVQGTIWDTNGGMLEWAIRNGFIEDNFWRNCVMCWNVG